MTGLLASFRDQTKAKFRHNSGSKSMVHPSIPTPIPNVNLSRTVVRAAHQHIENPPQGKVGIGRELFLLGTAHAAARRGPGRAGAVDGRCRPSGEGSAVRQQTSLLCGASHEGPARPRVATLACSTFLYLCRLFVWAFVLPPFFAALFG